MKKLIIITTLIMSSIIVSGQCTVDQFCLSFGNPQVVMGGTHFEVDLIVSSSSDFGLGTSNLQFNYNNNALASPEIVSTGIGVPNYQVPSITTPFIPSQGKMVGSFNIELNSPNTGMNVPMAGVVVCRLRFEITDPLMTSSLDWFYNGGTAQTVVFDDDESTQLCAVDPGVSCLEPSNSVLPLDLLSISATPKRNHILVEWTTDNEQNVSHFDVERSSGNTEFLKLNKIDAKNIHTGSTYSNLDYDVKPGTLYYYRLKMVDMDGRYEYSKVVSNKIMENEIVFQIYPNPIGSDRIINIDVNNSVQYELTLYDATNKLIMTGIYQDHNSIDLGELRAGAYFYKIKYEGGEKNGSVILK